MMKNAHAYQRLKFLTIFLFGKYAALMQTLLFFLAFYRVLFMKLAGGAVYSWGSITPCLGRQINVAVIYF